MKKGIVLGLSLVLLFSLGIVSAAYVNIDHADNGDAEIIITPVAWEWSLFSGWYEDPSDLRLSGDNASVNDDDYLTYFQNGLISHGEGFVKFQIIANYNFSSSPVDVDEIVYTRYLDTRGSSSDNEYKVEKVTVWHDGGMDEIVLANYDTGGDLPMTNGSAIVNNSGAGFTGVTGVRIDMLSGNRGGSSNRNTVVRLYEVNIIEKGDCSAYSATLGDLSEANRLYRFWDTVKGDTHFYTAGKNEAVKLMTTYYPQFVYEGVSGFVYEDAAGGDRVPLYRFFNNETVNDIHLYTIDETEKMLLEFGPDWELELSPGYVHPCSVTDSLAFHRYYNSVNEDNFYPTSLSEKDKIDTTPFAPWNQYAYQGVEGYLGDYGFEDESQIILSLNGSVGALGSLWNAGVVQKTIPGSCIGTVVACDGATQVACEGNAACTWIAAYNIYAYPMHRIYYDEIFGVAYTDANPHDCTGGNNVVDLSANMNVLVSPPDFGGLVDVCYGDLVCEYDASAGNDCLNGGEVVLRLEVPGISFAADPSDSSYLGKICCTSASAGPAIPAVCGDNLVTSGETCDVGLDGMSGGGDDVLGSATCVTQGFAAGTLNCAAGCGSYDTSACIPIGAIVALWADTEGKEITDSHLGATVKMILTNAGGVYDFEIYEEDSFIPGGFDDKIRVGAEAITGVLDGNGDLVAEWTITAKDLNEANDIGEMFDGFYFVVNGEMSKNLTISTTYYDDPMVVDIVSPDCADFYDNDTMVSINISADDPDDIIDGTLIIGEDLFSFSNGGTVFNYTFETAGNVQIVANSVNSRRVRQRDISNVMIIDTTKNDVYVAACITKPEDFSNIETGSVRFEAGTTRGINFTLPSNYEVIDKDNLNFHWTFSDGRVNHNVDGANSLSYSFFSNYTSAGNNWATLDVDVKGYL